MPREHLLGLMVALVAGSAGAATLTITPDKATYQVGEQIVLNVSGDAQGGVDNLIFGRILFDSVLADYVGSHQDSLTSLDGFIVWIASPLGGGPGFGQAFDQTPGFNVLTPDGLLTASVTLLATVPGTLDYSWQVDGGNSNFHLDFFGLTDAPGGSVVIVPEPASGALMGFGLIAWLILRRVARRDSARIGPAVFARNAS